MTMTNLTILFFIDFSFSFFLDKYNVGPAIILFYG